MAASSSSPLSLRNSSTQTYKFILFFFFLVFSASIKHSNGCYTSIFSFGDSIADTGNLACISESPQPPHFMLPPYGETYFHRSTGRCSDGRLVIDFIAEYLGLPLVPPYFSGQNGSCINFQEGVNFAIVGATALDVDFFEQRGIHNPFTNCSLGNQLHWFKKMLPSICHTPSKAEKEEEEGEGEELEGAIITGEEEAEAGLGRGGAGLGGDRAGLDDDGGLDEDDDDGDLSSLSLSFSLSLPLPLPLCD